MIVFSRWQKNVKEWIFFEKEKEEKKPVSSPVFPTLLTFSAHFGFLQQAHNFFGIVVISGPPDKKQSKLVGGLFSLVLMREAKCGSADCGIRRN